MGSYSKCEARTGTAIEHCWHGTGIHIAYYPPETEEICCYCGESRYKKIFYVYPDPTEHGKFSPDPRV